MRFAILYACLCILWVPSARAGFNGGVETFDGAIKDTAVWEQFLTNPNQDSLVQNDALFFTVHGFGNWVEYTTRSATIGIGGTARVDMAVSGTMNGELIISTNSAGTSNVALTDSLWFMLEYYSTVGRIGYFSGNSIGGHGHDSAVLLPPGPANLTLQITRISQTTGLFEAFSPSGVRLFSDAVACDCAAPSVADLFITLQGRGDGSVSFDNLRLSGTNNVPEPASLLCVALAALAKLPRRRR